MLDRRCMLQATTCFATLHWAGGAAAATVAGQARALRGQAAAEAGDARRNLDVGSEIYLGDLVTTSKESRLALSLGEHTTLKLGANTRIKIDRFMAEAGGDFELVDGHMMFEHTGRPKAFNARFRSTYGLIAVRGTRFYAGPNRGKFGVLVGEGHVTVTAAGRSVVVGPQEGTEIEMQGGPPSSPKEWGYSRVMEMLNTIR